jgi:hypothetical protein
MRFGGEDCKLRPIGEQAMRIAAYFAASLIVIGVAAPAAAESGYCNALQSELAALGGGGNNNKALRAQLAQAREDARRNNCNGGFFRKKGQGCGPINSRINRLERQLSSNRGGGFFFGRSNRDRERDRILRAMARYGCGSERQQPQQQANYGSYRTVCVRVCDGYYFPLSFAASRQRFATDAEHCAKQYGPGEAMLFYYPSPNGDPSQAMSLTNDRYADQPYAFAYRQSFDAQCQARLEEGRAMLSQRLMAEQPLAPPPQEEPVEPVTPFEQAIAESVPVDDMPVPIARQDAAEDPDTLSNRSGGFTPRITIRGPVIAGVDPSVRPVGQPYLFAEGNPGAPSTIPGYKPPELKDFRAALHASMAPTLR